MGQLEQAIEQIVKRYAGGAQIKQVLTGTARDVTDTTCTVERDGSPTLYGVRLNAVDDDLQSFATIVPADGSNVLVGIIENLKTEAVLLRCSEVRKVIMKTGDQTLVADKDGFVFNNGQLGGMVKIDKMVDWMGKVWQDLTVLQAQLSTHPVAGNGAALGLVFTPSTPQPAQAIFEDVKIKH